MRKYFLLSLLLLSAVSFLGVSSCATPVLPTITPLEANKYELAFRFECQGKDVFAVGSASCQFKEGDKMVIRIKTPKSRGEIQVRSCRHGRALDIDESKSWQTVEWVQYTREDSCPVVFSVATVDAGVQMGKIYPYVSNDTYPPLNGKGSLYCWQSENLEKFDGQLSCQIPTGTKTNGYLELKQDKSGQYLIVSPCLPAKLTGAFQKKSPPIKWSLEPFSAQFCPVSTAVKYDDGTIEEAEIYLDYFANIYRELPPPIMGERDGKSYACAPQDFKFFDLNDHGKKAGLLQGKCIADGWLDGGMAIGIAWDSAGRSSYAIYVKEGTEWNPETNLSQQTYRLSPQKTPL